MKQTTILSLSALLAIGMVLSGCNKAKMDDPVSPVENKDNIVTLTATVGFAPETKSLTEAGVKTFATGDKIAVIYKNTSNETVKAESVALTSGGSATASFTVTLTNPASNSAVRYIYPAAMAVDTPETTSEVNADANVNYAALGNQDGTLGTISSNYDLAIYDGTLSGTDFPSGAQTLTNKLAIAKFTIKKSDSSNITESVTRLYVSDGTNGYYIKLSSSQSTIFVAMQPVAAKTVKVCAKDASEWYTKTTASAITLASNNIYSIDVTMAAKSSEGLLSDHVFTVSAGGQKVKFSKGNLQAAYNGSDWTWKFADNQWGCIGNAAGNTKVTAVSPYISENATVDLFGWVGESSSWTGAAMYGITSSKATNNVDGYGIETDDKLKIDWGTTMGTGWRTLSSDEWTYLFNTRTVNGGTGEGKSYSKYKYVNGMGIVLYPDDYTGSEYMDSDWNTFESAGCVFLPAAGNRNGSSVNRVIGFGYYMSSTPDASNVNKTYILFTKDSDVYPANSSNRYIGFSVRLVQNQ